jgi:hypothetical protein
MLMRAIERRYAPRIRTEIASWMGQAIEAWEANNPVPQPNEHEARLRAILTEQAETAIRLFGERILGAQRAGHVVIERKDFAETLMRLGLRYIMLETTRRRITDIAETTRAQIIRGIERGFEEGLGVAETGRLVRDLVPGLSRYRAEMIARTETHSAANYGAHEAAEETGLTLRKEWIAAADERTRDDHVEADGQIVDMDEPFEVGGELLMYPGDGNGSPEQIINCFHPSVIIAPAGLKSAVKRHYVGQMVKMSLGAEINLTVTPNHPVLTDRGWVAASQIIKGDNLVYCPDANLGEIRPGFDVDYRQASAKQLYDAGEILRVCGRPSGIIVNFHGEVVTEQVDVVSFEGGLRNWMHAYGIQLFGQIALTSADVIPGYLLAARMVGLGNRVAPDFADGAVGGAGPGLALTFAEHGGSAPVAFGDVRFGNPQIAQARRDHSSTHADCFGNGIHGVTGANHLFDYMLVAFANDAPSVGGAAFEFRKVASVKSFHYEGSVYNFESDNNILCANGIVNHNCRCSVAHIVVD